MAINEDYFILDVSDTAIEYVGADDNEETITAYAGIRANAQMGENFVKVYIPAPAMDLLCSAWKVADGQDKVESEDLIGALLSG